MNIFTNLLQQFTFISQNMYMLFANATFLIFFQTVSLFVLSKIIIDLVTSLFHQGTIQKQKTLLIFFIIPIVAIMSENISEIARFLFPKTPFTRTLVCCAWIFSCFKFHSFLFFLERLTSHNVGFKRIHKLLFSISTVLSSLFIIDTAFLITHSQHIYFSNYLHYATVIHWITCIIISIVHILQKVHTQNIPVILKKQLNILLKFFLIPHFICIFLEFSPMLYSGEFATNHHIVLFNNLSLIFITLTFYFCYKRIMQLRFLNISNHIEAQPAIRVTTSFKDTIEQLNLVTKHEEFQYIAENFFYEQFNIHKKDVKLYIRNDHKSDNHKQIVEKFFNNENLPFHATEVALEHKLFMKHDIEFDAYNTNNEIVTTLVSFLDNINSDIFIPILNNKNLTGYITIQKNSSEQIYNQEEQHKMMIFAQFLAPAIHVLSQKNLYTLMKDAKETKEALYAKHQEVNQYKESIKKLLKDRVENHIGIIFYKNKNFSFRSQETQALLGINPNIQHNHPTTATLINLAQQVEKFKTTQSICITVHNGTKLIIKATPYAECSHGILLTVRRPEATDIITSQVDALKDPSKRDYLLYLETTTAGQLINTLIPGNNEPFLQVKIQLLQAALQKQALLLQAPTNDLQDIVEIIHTISLKKTLKIIDLTGMQSHECAIKLFGINTLLQTNSENALLEQLDQGTLFIQNIEYLDTTSQQKLAHFIRYGIFTPLKSEHRKFSDVRIICSTKENIHDLVRDQKILPELYNELQKSWLNLPSLVGFTQEDMSNLIDGFMHQALQEKNDATITPLTAKEKTVIFEKRIESLAELKQKINALMKLKAQENHVSKEALHSGVNNIDNTCPELTLAAKLGKDTLKDIQLMTSLWKRLGSQSKIAELIGVNRSSVNRRCKDYNLS